MVKPNYSARSPVVNDAHFSDTALPKPTIGSAQSTYNPGQNSAAFPKGPPKYVQVPGKRVYAKGMTNKRIGQTI